MKKRGKKINKNKSCLEPMCEMKIIKIIIKEGMNERKKGVKLETAD